MFFVLTYLTNCLSYCVGYVASNTQMGFHYHALFFREQIRQNVPYILRSPGTTKVRRPLSFDLSLTLKKK